MKRCPRKPACLLLAVLLALSLFAGCGGIPASYVSPSPEATPPPTQTDTPAAPSTSAAIDPTLTPSPSPTDTPAASPADTAAVSPSPTATDTGTPPAVTPSPTPSVAPTATPGAPSFSHDGDRADVTVLEYYDFSFPAGLQLDLKYTKYASSLHYFVVLKSSSVKELPDAGSKTLKKVSYSNRLTMTARVQGADGKSVWYRVRVGSSMGYIEASAGSPRVFQLKKALNYVLRIQETADQSGTVRISAYNNKPLGGKKVMPPKLPGSKTVDSFGVSRDQAAPAYLTPDKSSSFRYIPDGTLCQALRVKGDFTEVYVPYWDEVRYIPTIYIEKRQVDNSKTDDVIPHLTQAVVVDRTNQNIIVCELRGSQWYVISMCYVSTGKKGGYYQLTPLGAYFTDKRPKGSKGIGEFWFMADGVNENDPASKYEGYAPWAVRFSAGAYLHGLPVNVSYDETTQKVIFTGRTYESASFLGVRPESHMCVRNYTSHAKFMYNWVKDGQATVIIID